MTHRMLVGLLALAPALAPLATAQVAPRHVALTGARVIPVSGSEMDKATILISDGKIAEVGTDVKIPYDARVYDFTDKVIMPGLIIADTARGLDRSNESRPVTPQLDVYDALDPSQLFFEECLRHGVTAAHVIPGGNTVIGGTGRVVRPIGRTPDEMTIARSGLRLSVTPRGGYDRMRQMFELREALLKHQVFIDKLAERKYEEQLEKDEKKIDVGPEEAAKRGLPLIEADDIDDENYNLLRLLGGAAKVGEEEPHKLLEPIPVFVHAAAATDVGPAVAFAREHGFLDRTVFLVGPETHKAVDELKAAARPVVLTDLVYSEIDPVTGERSETFVPKVFQRSRLKYAILPGRDRSLPENMLTFQAARLVREGISRSSALRAITLHAAEATGLAERMGSIEAGKIANLVVMSGDPLRFDSVVERVFVDGIPAYDRAADPRLQRLLTPEKSDPEEPAE